MGATTSKSWQWQASFWTLISIITIVTGCVVLLAATRGKLFKRASPKTIIGVICCLVSTALTTSGWFASRMTIEGGL